MRDYFSPPSILLAGLIMLIKSKFPRPPLAGLSYRLFLNIWHRLKCCLNFPRNLVFVLFILYFMLYFLPNASTIKSLFFKPLLNFHFIGYHESNLLHANSHDFCSVFLNVGSNGSKNVFWKIIWNRIRPFNPNGSYKWTGLTLVPSGIWGSFGVLASKWPASPKQLVISETDWILGPGDM